jgi:hypothetical protein
MDRSKNTNIQVELLREHSYPIPIDKIKKRSENLAQISAYKQKVDPSPRLKNDSDEEILSPYVKCIRSERSMTSSSGSENGFDRDEDEFKTIGNAWSPLLKPVHLEFENEANLKHISSQNQMESWKLIDKKNTEYMPSKLHTLFESRMKELMPLLSSKYNSKSDSMCYFLEDLWKEFLYALLTEKPSNIHMKTMNLYNFDKAVLDLIKHFKFKEIQKQIEVIEASIRGNWKNLIDSAYQVERTRDPKLSPNTQKFLDSDSFSDFKSAQMKTMKREVSDSFTDIIKNRTILEATNHSILEANKTIKKLSDKNEKLEESIKTMRYTFMKELQGYKNQLFILEKFPETFEPIKVHYFTGLESIDEQTLELLNKKIDLITDDYNFKLLRMQKYNMSLEEKIGKFEKIWKEKNVGITINELSADDIIHKLSIVESEAAPIWEAFSKYYGGGFFNKMIEKEFGINPDTHEEIGNKFGQEVNNLRETSNEKFSQFVAEAKEQIDHIQTSLRQKRTEYLALKEEFEDEIEKIRKALEEKSQQHIEQIKGADFKRYDEEKAELYAVIRNLEGEIEQFKNNPRNRHTSDLFKDKIRPKKEMKAEKEGEDEEEKKPIDWPLLSQNIIDRLRSEKTKIEKEMLNFKYLFSVEEQNYKRVSDRYKIAINDISFLRDGKTT